MDQIRPAQFSIFKGKSALRLGISKPIEDYSTGFLFVEFAEVKGKNDSGNRIYDWENKIGVKLGMADISKLSYALQYGDSLELFHKTDKSSKIISLQRSTEGSSPYFFSVSQQGGKKISVPISGEEAYALLCVFKHSIPKILNW